MESLFSQAMLIRPPEILGRKLRHFSCFHALLLDQLENPLLVPGRKPVSQSDLVQAIWVCSLKFESWAKIESGRLARQGLSWGKREKDYSFDVALQQFVDYLDSYVNLPKIYGPAGSRRKTGIPWFFKLPAQILANYNQFTEAQVWDMPLVRLACYRAEIAESNGMQVQTAVEAALHKRIREAGLEWRPGAAKAKPKKKKKRKKKRNGG